MGVRVRRRRAPSLPAPFAISRRGLILSAAASLAAPAARAAAPLQVVTDVSSAPDLLSWADALQALCRGWWPKITALLAEPGFTPPGRIEIRILRVQPSRVAAAAEGTIIYVDADHVRANPDTGFVAHELVHVAQAYPPSRIAWLSEGIADYLRYYVLLPNDPQRRYDRKLTYAVGYQPAAAMLDWAVGRYGKTLIRRVNTAMRSGHDGEAALTLVTGETPQALWETFVSERDRS